MIEFAPSKQQKVNKHPNFVKKESFINHEFFVIPMPRTEPAFFSNISIILVKNYIPMEMRKEYLEKASLESVCKKQQKIIPDQVLVCELGDL